MMTQKLMPFQYQAEKSDSGLTAFAGLPLYIELAIKSGLTECIKETLKTKHQGWSDTEMILSLILINLVGGDCISDIERLEQDTGLRTLLMQFATHGMKRQTRRLYEKRWRKAKQRGLPSNAAIHRYLPQFHSPEEETYRVGGKAFIPKANELLTSLIGLNKPLIEYTQQLNQTTTATLDQDATLVETHKKTALYCYKKYKAYQPFNTYWAEQGLILHSEFRDGNVNAGFEQLRLLKEALTLLPNSVKKVLLRSDSAGYQEELLTYCAEGKDARFGVIEFAIAAKVTPAFKQAVAELKSNAWQPFYQTQADGSQIKTNQEWAEVCFVPTWTSNRKNQASYRYLAIREPLVPSTSSKDVEELDLPFQTIESKGTAYKLFSIITNRTCDGNTLIQWHRERCGKSEQLHSAQKEGFAGGQLPSNLFGVNAAWWQMMILALNLNRLMQLAALPEPFKERRIKAIRYHVINLPGRIIKHARQLYLRVEREAYDFFESIRERIASLSPLITTPIVDSS